MKVTDLNPDAKWAIATSVITTFQRYNDPWKPWAYATGLSYLYDTGYGCINGSPGYAPGYWHKKNPNDLKIWYSWDTVKCKTCDPSKTDVTGWDYWTALGAGCLDPPTSPNIPSIRTWEVSVEGIELTPIAPFTTKAVIFIQGILLIGWIPNADPAGATALVKGQSDHFMIGKLVPTIGGWTGKFFGENTTAQPKNHGRFILKTYEVAYYPLLYKSGLTIERFTRNPKAKLILLKFADGTLKTFLVRDEHDLLT